MSLLVWRKKYYPICLNNMALCAYRVHQQWDHCLPLPALLSLPQFLFRSISQCLYLHPRVKPFLSIRSRFSAPGHGNAISSRLPSAMSSIKYEQTLGLNVIYSSDGPLKESFIIIYFPSCRKSHISFFPVSRLSVSGDFVKITLWHKILEKRCENLLHNFIFFWRDAVICN